MTVGEKIALIDEVCDEIEKLADEDLAKNSDKSELVLATILMERTNINIARAKLKIKSINERQAEIAESLMRLKMTEEEES